MKPHCIKEAPSIKTKLNNSNRLLYKEQVQDEL